MTPEPTPEQLERARRIINDNADYMNGLRQNFYRQGEVQRMLLAAILESDQRYAELLAHAEAMAGALDTIAAFREFQGWQTNA